MQGKGGKQVAAKYAGFIYLNVTAHGCVLVTKSDYVCQLMTEYDIICLYDCRATNNMLKGNNQATKI